MGYDDGIRDAILAQHVNDVLREVESLASHPIKADCVDGTIYLRGKVESRHQMSFAEEVARGLPGVKDVVNELDLYYEEKSPLLHDLPPVFFMRQDSSNHNGT